MKLRNLLVILCCVVMAIPVGAASFFYLSYRPDRLDFKNPDDLYMLEKSVGFRPSSQEVYLHSFGSLDPTVFYKAKVTPGEVGWLAEIPEVPPFTAPGGAPFWWHVSKGENRFFRTNTKWPSLYVYDAKGGWIYGTKEYD